MDPKSPFNQLQLPAELACEFFAVFSRFEYALKEFGYRKAGRNATAEPDWDKFADDVANSFQDSQPPEVVQVVTYLLSEPPMRQFIKNGSLNWRPLVLPDRSQVHKALLAVRTVRNNLFHGGKHTPHSPPGRDERLVKSSLIVLKRCLQLHNGLRTEYELSA